MRVYCTYPQLRLSTSEIMLIGWFARESPSLDTWTAHVSQLYFDVSIANLSSTETLVYEIFSDSQYFSIADSSSTPGNYGSLGVFTLGAQCRGVIRIIPNMDYIQKWADYLKKVLALLVSLMQMI